MAMAGKAHRPLSSPCIVRFIVGSFMESIYSSASHTKPSRFSVMSSELKSGVMDSHCSRVREISFIFTCWAGGVAFHLADVFVEDEINETFFHLG